MPHSSGGGSSSSFSGYSSSSSSSHSSSSHSSSYSSSSGPNRHSVSSHSGSHSSGPNRHSSSSHSSSSSSYSPTEPTIRREPFLGASKYVRVRNDRTETIYVSGNPKNYTGGTAVSILRGLLKFLLWFNLILALIILVAGCFAFRTVDPINANYDKSIQIEDSAGVFDSTDKLMSSLQSFQDLTGITPAVFTVNNEDWLGSYSDLEPYALDLYMHAFSDEYHWLIVFTRPEDPEHWEDWVFEGIQGDLTDDIILSSLSDSFNENLQASLNDPAISPEDAFSDAFCKAETRANNIMNPEFEPEYLLVLLPFLLLAAIPALLLWLLSKLVQKRYDGFVRSKGGK